MSTLKTINVIHPSGSTNNIVNDASGNVTIGGTVTAATHIGGTAASSSLTLQSTSGVGTSDSILFKVGNNGATTAMTVDTSGNVGIGTSLPYSILDVSSATLASTLNATQNNTSMLFRTDSNTDRLVFKATRFAAGSDWTSANLTLGREIANTVGAYPRITFGNNTAGTFDPMLELSVGYALLRMTYAGNVGIGTSAPNASAILDAQSTTKGVRFPNMTTTEKNAVSSPAAGLVVFDTTLSKLCVYSGSAWETVTSV